MSKKFRQKDRKDRKAWIQRAHAKKAAWDRYRVNLNQKEMSKAVNQVIETRSIFVGWSTNTRTLHLVWVQCTWLPVVFNKNNHCLNTVLPWEVMPKWAAMDDPDVKWSEISNPQVKKLHEECINGRYAELRPPFQWELQEVTNA